MLTSKELIKINVWLNSEPFGKEFDNIEDFNYM
jgi:hypothetical protein